MNMMELNMRRWVSFIQVISRNPPRQPPSRGILWKLTFSLEGLSAVPSWTSSWNMNSELYAKNKFCHNSVWSLIMFIIFSRKPLHPPSTRIPKQPLSAPVQRPSAPWCAAIVAHRWLHPNVVSNTFEEYWKWPHLNDDRGNNRSNNSKFMLDM